MDLNFQRLMTRLGYRFHDTGLLERALTHRSAGAVNNERLEFLGDAVLGLVVAELLYQRHPQADEGGLSRLRAHLVKGESLAKVARELEIGECLNLGPGEMKSGGHRRSSILADALEAILGAIYIESGLESSREAVERWFGERLDGLDEGAVGKDSKTLLQEYLQGRGEGLPNYQVVSSVGEPHNKVFTVQCSLPLLNIPVTGTGTSRRRAEQDAARRALDYLLDDGKG